MTTMSLKTPSPVLIPEILVSIVVVCFNAVEAHVKGVLAFKVRKNMLNKIIQHAPKEGMVTAWTSLALSLSLSFCLFSLFPLSLSFSLFDFSSSGTKQSFVLYAQGVIRMGRGYSITSSPGSTGTYLIFLVIFELKTDKIPLSISLGALLILPIPGVISIAKY